MPRIDPLQLLTCLNVLLAKNGGVLSQAEVKRLAGLMVKYSKKLVSKCIYIQILKCTKTDLLGEFMGAGGWSLTHMWLTDGIRAMNWPLVQEILELLLLCPVDVQRLKTNSAPKLVKQLSKDGGNEGVRIYATRLVEQWLNVVKSETKPINSSESTDINNSISLTTNLSNKLSGMDTVSSSTSPTTIANSLQSPPSSGNQNRKSSNDSTLMYKIVVKDGKQVLSKIENSGPSTTTNSNENNNSIQAAIEADFDEIANLSKNIDELDSKLDDKSNKENEKKIKDLENKKSSKDKSKSSNSSSSSNKDKHKSSTHRSSSKSSSSRSSGGGSSSKSKSSSTSSSSHHRSSTESGSSKSRSDKHKSSSSRSESSSSKSSSKDKHRDKSISKLDKDKEKADQAEKDKETLSKILPPNLEKLGKIPKKLKDETGTTNAKTPVQPVSITIPSKKASMSIEIRRDADKAKTVKTYKSQFRSHGLTEEAPPPPSRKNLKKPSSLSLPGTSIPNNFTTSSSSLSLKRSSPPPTAEISTTTTATTEKDQQAVQSSEKKSKIDLISLPVNSIEKPGAIKLIPAKPKPASLVESDMFMDALFASAAPKKDIRKRKRRTSGSKEPGSPTDSPVTVKAAPLKFYQDTLDEKDENKGDGTSDDKNKTNGDDDDKNNKDGEDFDDDIPLKKVKEDIEEKFRQGKGDNDDSSQDRSHNLDDDIEMIGEAIKKPPGPGCGPDGPPGVLMLHRRRGPKKKLKWRPQEQLEEIRFFEMDETERVNVTKTFTDMKQMERCGEREAFLLARKLNCEDIMVEQTPWKPLIFCEDVPTHPDGSQSKEKKIQAEREQSTLKALYFSRAMIPDSGSEPEMEHCPITEPTVIPLDDITGNPDAVNDYMKYGWPEPKGTPPQNSDDNINLGSNGPVRLLENDMKYQNNPFIPFGGGAPNGPWQMGTVGGGVIPPVNGLNNLQNGGSVIIPPNLLTNAIVNPFQIAGNAIPANLLMGINGTQQMSPSDIKNPLMQQFVPIGGNFGPPNGMMNGPTGPMGNLGNNNFGGTPMNMNGLPNMNMNVGPNRGIRGNNGGNWRPGGPTNNNNGGNNWRGSSGGGVNNNNNQRGWVHGNVNNNGRGICKSFMRGFCRNGSKCSYAHPGPNNNRI